MSKYHFKEADSAVLDLQDAVGSSIARALAKHAPLLKPEVLDAILNDVEPETRLAAKKHVQTFALNIAGRWREFITAHDAHRREWEMEAKEAGLRSRLVFTNDFVMPYNDLVNTLEAWGRLDFHHGEGGSRAPTARKDLLYEGEHAESLRQRYAALKRQEDEQRAKQERDRVVDAFLEGHGLTRNKIKLLARSSRSSKGD